MTEQELGLQFPDPQIGAAERHVCLKAWLKSSGADLRVGPAPLAHRDLLRRCMRCVQRLAKGQREQINILQPAPFTIQNPALKR